MFKSIKNFFARNSVKFADFVTILALAVLAMIVLPYVFAYVCTIVTVAEGTTAAVALYYGCFAGSLGLMIIAVELLKAGAMYAIDKLAARKAAAAAAPVSATV